MNKTLSKAVLTIVFSLASYSAIAATYNFSWLDWINGSVYGEAKSINNSGQIVGFSNTGNGARATIWNNGVATDC